MNKIPTTGSEIAKQGFKNEKYIVSKFNNREHDHEARTWLRIMGYDLSEIEFVKAMVLFGY